MVARVQARVRRRVLAAYCRQGVLDAEGAKDMAAWDHDGGWCSSHPPVDVMPDCENQNQDLVW
jgi:hypothetical protein